MYIAKKNKALSDEAVIEFINKYGFGILISHVDSQFEAVHIPMEYYNSGGKHMIHGHVALGNKLTHAIEKSSEVMAIFSEPHAYISSSWYDHVNVPTWNYIAVHAYGKIRKLEAEELHDSIKSLVDRYEDGLPGRFDISDMPEDMLQAHLNGVTGFEIMVERFESNFKLSQNRNDKNFANIINHLEQSENLYDREISEEMLKTRS